MDSSSSYQQEVTNEIPNCFRPIVPIITSRGVSSGAQASSYKHLSKHKITYEETEWICREVDGQNNGTHVGQITAKAGLNKFFCNN